MDKSSLGVHKIKLMVQSSPSLSNSSGVRQHAHSTLDLSQVSSRDHGWGLVVDSNLENFRVYYLVIKYQDIKNNIVDKFLSKIMIYIFKYLKYLAESRSLFYRDVDELKLRSIL